MTATALPPFRLVGRGRAAALDAVANAPDGWWVRLSPPKRSAEQNRLLHSALNDIAEQVKWHGEQLTADVWKRLCTAAWLRERGAKPLLLPALDGNGVDIIYERTSQLSVSECSDLLSWCYAFGAEHGVQFKL